MFQTSPRSESNICRGDGPPNGTRRDEPRDGVFVVDKPADKMVGTVSVRANADGTKTFVANVVTGGLTIIFR
jgi:hypothetical protein